MPVTLILMSAKSEGNDDEIIEAVGTCNDSRNITVDV